MTASPKSSPAERRSPHLTHKIEQAVYIVVAVLPVLLLGAAALLWSGGPEFTATEPVCRIIDRLLFVLMLVEILHTVHAPSAPARSCASPSSSWA